MNDETEDCTETEAINLPPPEHKVVFSITSEMIDAIGDAKPDEVREALELKRRASAAQDGKEKNELYSEIARLEDSNGCLWRRISILSERLNALKDAIGDATTPPQALRAAQRGSSQ